MAKKYSLEEIKYFLGKTASLGDALYFAESELKSARKAIKKKAKKEARKKEKSYNKEVLTKEGTLNTGEVKQNIWTYPDK